jgi:hypothetical protein
LTLRRFRAIHCIKEKKGLIAMRMVNTEYTKRKRREKTKMSHDDFHRERLYQATLAIVRIMHTKNIIASSDFTKIELILLEKYKPLLGTLYSVNAGLFGNTVQKSNITQI